MALVISFTMVLVATTPLHLPWLTAYLWEFDGPTLSGSIGGAPVALYTLGMAQRADKLDRIVRRPA